MKICEGFVNSPSDSAYSYAKELKKQILEGFSFVLDNEDEGFCPQYVTASFLSPAHKPFVPSSLMPSIESYIAGKTNGLVISLLFDKVFCVGFVGGDAVHTPVVSGELEFCLPGLECLAEEMTESFKETEVIPGKFIV